MLYLLKHADEYQVPTSCRISEIEQKLREKLDNNQINNRNKASLSDELLIDRLFTNYSLYYKDRQIATKNKQNTDFLRAIKISDSEPLIRPQVPQKNSDEKVKYNLAVIAETIISSYFNNNNAKYKASIFAEVVRDVHTEFTITLDREMLNWFRHQESMIIPFNSIDKLIKICQEFVQEQWDGEFDYWQNIRNNKHQGKNLDFDLIRDFYKLEKCPYQLRLGWGSGMTGTTIDWLLEDDLRAEIRDACGKPAPDFEAPKSRRTLVNSQGEITYVPGWVELTPL